MELILNENDVANLRIQVREATKSMLPGESKSSPSYVSLTMSGDGKFENHSSWSNDDHDVMLVASISRPYEPYREGRASRPVNPYYLRLEIMSDLFGHMEDEIKGYISEYIAEEVLRNSRTGNTVSLVMGLCQHD